MSGASKSYVHTADQLRMMRALNQCAEIWVTGEAYEDLAASRAALKVKYDALLIEHLRMIDEAIGRSQRRLFWSVIETLIMCFAWGVLLCMAYPS